MTATPTTAQPWRHPLRIAEVPGRGLHLTLSPPADARADIARTLGLVSLEAFDAVVDVQPWLDGLHIAADWSARVVQTCGVSLEPFEQALADTFEIKALPAASPNLPPEAGEVSLDAEADDPPDPIEGGAVDLAAYLIEHLSLAIDPYPRKPGAVFDADRYVTPEPSPFAVLSDWKPKP